MKFIELLHNLFVLRYSILIDGDKYYYYNNLGQYKTVTIEKEYFDCLRNEKLLIQDEKDENKYNINPLVLELEKPDVPVKFKSMDREVSGRTSIAGLRILNGKTVKSVDVLYMIMVDVDGVPMPFEIPLSKLYK